MRIWSKLAIAASLLISTSAPTLAFMICETPEIDGPAGVSAIALIASASMIAYNRVRQ